MSVLLAVAALAAASSVIAAGCIAYILISFWRSGPLIASRAGNTSLAVVMVKSAGPHHRRLHSPLRPAHAH